MMIKTILLRFGVMVWNEKNNEKWTTKYVNEKNWEFIDTEIAFPNRSNCHKNHTNPELLITIHNENLTRTSNPKIDQPITIHIKTRLIEPNKLIDIEKYIYQIGSLPAPSRTSQLKLLLFIDLCSIN
jgi:hypothetical protein